MRKVFIIGFSVIAAFVLCIAVGVGGVIFFVSKGLDEPKSATGDFLTVLEAGNTEGAYQMLCRTAQTNYGPEEFASLVKEHPYSSHDISWGGSYSNENGIETASVTASITHTDGITEDHTFPLRKENGAWKVCGDPM